MDRDAAREQVLKQCGTVLAGPGNPVEFRDRQRVTGTDDCEQRGQPRPISAGARHDVRVDLFGTCRLERSRLSLKTASFFSLSFCGHTCVPINHLFIASV